MDEASTVNATVDRKGEPLWQPPPVATKPPDFQSQLEQHIMAEHELEEKHTVR
jgi:hypothetical protein